MAKGPCTYLVWIASETEPHQTMASTVDGQDICRLSQRKVIQYEGERLKGEVPEIEEELHDPSYQPKEEGETSESSEALEQMEDEPKTCLIFEETPYSNKKKSKKTRRKLTLTQPQSHPPRRHREQTSSLPL